MPQHSQYDFDHDSFVTEEELEFATKLADLKRNEERFKIHKRMAWGAMFVMVFFTGILFLPVMSTAKVALLTELVAMLYFAMAGVIASFFGSTAWMEVGTPRVQVNTRPPTSRHARALSLGEGSKKPGGGGPPTGSPKAQ